MSRNRKKSKIVREQDQNFDGLSQKFSQNIYQTLKGEIRKKVLIHELNIGIESMPHPPQSILDVGGGQGQIALHLAQNGFDIELVDPSLEMLKIAQSKFFELNLSHRLKTNHSTIQAHLKSQKYDLILFHAVLEWLESPREVLQQILDHLSEGGALSLMFYNYYGLEMHHLINGNFDHIHKGMQNKKTNTTIPLKAFKPEEIQTWLTEAGFCVKRSAGVRVIHDFLKDKDNALRQEYPLLEMELTKSTHPAYKNLGRYMHFWVESK